jgi:hypothetical protein
VLPADADRLPLTPVVDVARAVADAAFQYRDPGRVRALVTSAVAHRACRVQDLVTELDHCPRGGSAAFRIAVGDALDGAHSVAEARAARILSRAPAFELNVPIVRGGRVLYVVDVFWRTLRAVLEIDSREFHFGEGQ